MIAGTSFPDLCPSRPTARSAHPIEEWNGRVVLAFQGAVLDQWVKPRVARITTDGFGIEAWRSGACDPVVDRILSLRGVKDGWMGEGTLAPPVDLVEQLARGYRKSFLGETPRPSVFPTPEGGVEFEWRFGERTVSVEIASDGKADLLAFYSRDDDDDRDVEESFDLGDESEWNCLKASLSRLSSIE